MKVAIIQPNFIPWRGYFDIIDDCDLFIVLDDVQYTNRDWRNRNHIKTRNGLNWLIIPVKYNHRQQLIYETYIDRSQDWANNHIKTIKHNYCKAPYYDLLSNELFEILKCDYDTILDLDLSLIHWAMKHLFIDTRICSSSEFNITSNKTNRLIELLVSNNATSYISGPSARDYLDESLFIENKINLEFKTYDYQAYPQLWGNFCGNVSIIDLLFNCGPDSHKHLKSISKNKVAVNIE